MRTKKAFSILLSLLFMMILAACGGGVSTQPVSSTGGDAGGSGVAILSWSAPTTNVDGTPLVDLAGYKIYYGTAHGSYSTVRDVGTITTVTINNLAPRTYYFVATTYNAMGLESTYSNEIVKTIQ